MLPEPPAWPREESETPRLDTCGTSCSIWAVLVAPELSMSARVTEITGEPTGATPRMRLPVTTTWLSAGTATGAAGWATGGWAATGSTGAGASWAMAAGMPATMQAAAKATAVMRTGAGWMRWAERAFERLREELFMVRLQ
jgi:hypothetical protein